METIKNYLESMFRNLPATEKVMRAKSELLQMMEDKYTELIKEGKSENEAVRTVISEFGNLEELSKDLGVDDIFKSTRTSNLNRRKVTFDEANEFLNTKKHTASFTALGIALCIMSVAGPICSDAFRLSDKLGVSLMFLMIGFGVALMIMASIKLSQFDFLKNEDCDIDSVTIQMIKNKRREFYSTYSVRLSVGVMLCVLCILPPVVFDHMGLLEDLSGALLFIFVGTGVYFIVSSNIMKKAYELILGVNYSDTSIKNHKKGNQVTYKNNKVKVIMSVFWPTVTCIYLCWSFATLRWDISWLIWPIAGVGSGLINAIFSNSEDNND